MGDTQPRMTWTTDAPTTPGWYWWKTANGLNIVRLVSGGKEGSLVIQFEGGHLEYLDNVITYLARHHIHAEWQGPLTPHAGPLEAPE